MKDCFTIDQQFSVEPSFECRTEKDKIGDKSGSKAENGDLFKRFLNKCVAVRENRFEVNNFARAVIVIFLPLSLLGGMNERKQPFYN